jgi:DNA-binding NarL/FixJ family response regulator
VPNRPSRNRTGVLLAGKDRDFLETLSGIVDARPPFEVLAIAGSDQEAVTLAESLAPSIVLIDGSEEDSDRVETIRRFRDLSSKPAVVVLSSEGQNGNVPDFDPGADAYLQKSSDLASIIDVVLAFAVQRRANH